MSEFLRDPFSGEWERAGGISRRVRTLELEKTAVGSGTPHGLFTEYMLSFSSLLAWWRLGEAASPFADTSGRFPLNTSPAAKVARGAALTTDVAGALPPAQDDGAILFNSNGTAGDYLDVAAGTADFDFVAGIDSFTVAAWVKVKADAGTFTGAVISNRFSSPPDGWALHVNWPARTVTWYRKDVGGTLYTVTSPSLVADTWYFLTGRYKGSTTTMELFVDAASVGTQVSAGGLPNWNLGPQIGGGAPNGSADYYFYGTIDEVAIWDAALTDPEILEIYTRGAAALASEPAGKVWTSDGAGGGAWEYPTIETRRNGA